MSNQIKVSTTMRAAVMLLLSLFVSLGVYAQEPVEQVVDIPDQNEAHRALTDPWSISFLSPNSDEESDDEETASKFYVDTQLRTRGEYRHGQGTLHATGAEPAWFVNERARFGLGYEQKQFSVKISAQHTGVWGDTGIDNNGGGDFSLYEGWARVNLPKGFFMQAGRMVLSYDDQRIFGSDDWSRSGRSHDGFRFGFENDMHKVHGILSFSQTHERTIGGTYYHGDVPYKNMQALWYHYGKTSSPLQFSLLALNRSVQSGTYFENSTTRMQTFGAWVQYQKNGFYGKAEGYFQTGLDTLKREVCAYLLGGRVGYKSRIVDAEAGADYISGVCQDSTKCLIFDTMFGSDHEFFGPMDYFTRNNMIFTGVCDANLKVTVRPIRNLSIDAGYHYFLTGRAFPGLHRTLGQEVDLHASWNITKGVTLEAGYSTMMATSVMFYFRDGNNKLWQDWGWLSLNVDLRAFSAKFKRK